eukprot:scaffold5055_cov58-Phaeocystis_antarctica.AAC.3
MHLYRIQHLELLLALLASVAAAANTARDRRWRRCSPLRRRLPLRQPCQVQGRLLGSGEAAQAHLLATAPHPRLIRLAGVAGPEGDAEVARPVVGHAQRQPLRLRLLPRLLARHWLRRCGILHGRCLPLWRARDAQRRLLGGGEGAQAHYYIAATAPVHPRLEGLRLAIVLEIYVQEARLVVGQAQRQPLRLRLLPRLLARQRRRRCSPLRRHRSPLRRTRDAQRRLLGGDEPAQGH